MKHPLFTHVVVLSLSKVEGGHKTIAKVEYVGAKNLKLSTCKWH